MKLLSLKQAVTSTLFSIYLSGAFTLFGLLAVLSGRNTIHPLWVAALVIAAAQTILACGKAGASSFAPSAPLQKRIIPRWMRLPAVWIVSGLFALGNAAFWSTQPKPLICANFLLAGVGQVAFGGARAWRGKMQEAARA